MLREIYRSVPIPYFKRGEETQFVSYFLGLQYAPNQEPWMETIDDFVGAITGLHVGRMFPFEPMDKMKHATPDSPSSIYMFTDVLTNWWPSYGFGFYKFDGRSGKLIRRMFVNSTLGVVLNLAQVHTSRSGTPYATASFGTTLKKMTLGKSAEALIDDEPETADTWNVTGESIPITRFGHWFNEFNIEQHLFSFGLAGSWAVDETSAFPVYIDGSFRFLRVFNLNTGDFHYEIQMPDNIVDIALEDEQRCYVLLGDRTVILFDYYRGEVLGAVKIPTLVSGKSYWNNSDVRMTWDSTFRRLLVAEKTPDTATGAATTCIRGFRQVPEPVVLTTPIPLQAPRVGRTVPVLVRALGDMCEGVGGYVVSMRVSGAGTPVGIPISDYAGDTKLLVHCDAESAYYDEGYDTGSSETTTSGGITVNATIVVYQPDPADVPVIAAPGTGFGGTTTGGGGVAGGEQPGPPGGGTDPGTDLPETAPNMQYIMQRVKDSGTWQTAEIYDPAGRGKFLEACVVAMHDVDAGWGFNRKTGGNQYNGHSVDFISWKNPDGVTAEGFDVLSGGAGNITWGFAGRNAGTLDHHYYPA